VSDLWQGMPLMRRAMVEHRRLALGLASALVVNVLVYALIVAPLAERVANIEQRDLQAEQALASARLDHARASGTLAGKDRAAAELATFYADVLPQDEAGARRLTYLRVRRLAEDSGLGFQSGLTELQLQPGRTLRRLRSQVTLSGSWNDVRAFVYQLETAPEFVVIDNVELIEAQAGENLVVTVDLSTYFRADVDPGP
jgi:hypothetical protein